MGNIPHLNDLARHFKGQPVDFFSIDTYETRQIVERFLKAHPMEGTVATDRNSETTSEYAISGTPATVLVSREGRVEAICSPEQITPAVIDRLLSNQALDLSASNDREIVSMVARRRTFLSNIKLILDDRALVGVAMIPTTNIGGLISSVDQVESTGSTLLDLLSFAYDVPNLRIVIPSELAEETYELQAWVPAAAMLKPLLQTSIQAAAAVSVREEQRTMSTFRLDGLPGKLVSVPPTKILSSHCETGIMQGDGIGIDILRGCIEQQVHKPVVVEGSFTTAYRYNMSWDAKTPGAFEAALKDQLGLLLTPTQSKMDVLLVQPAKTHSSNKSQEVGLTR